MDRLSELWDDVFGMLTRRNSPVAPLDVDGDVRP
jgi:hypothetical protein